MKSKKNDPIKALDNIHLELNQWSMFLRASITGVRLFSTSAVFRKPKDLHRLEFTIKQRLKPIKGKTIEHTAFLKSIKDLIKYRKTTSSETELNQVDSIFKDIVQSPNFRIDTNELKDFFLLKLPVENTTALINSFYNKNPGVHIPKSIAMIPLRQYLWDAEIDSALKIVELTTGSDTYIQHKKVQQNKKLINYFAGLTGLMTTMDLSLRYFGVQPSFGIYAMVITYILNITFYASMAFGGKVLQNDDYIQYVKGVPRGYRALHNDEMEMISRVASVDVLVNGVDSFASAKFVDYIRDKNFQLTESENEILIQEYWLSGGDNFEWTEPDQDPADILWKQRLENLKPKAIKSDVNWTEKLIDSKKENESNLQGVIA